MGCTAWLNFLVEMFLNMFLPIKTNKRAVYKVYTVGGSETIVY
jgi:hypothetical protein